MRAVPIDTAGKSWFRAIKIWWRTQRQWEVVQDWFYTLPNGHTAMVPKGYVFNGASVPRYFRTYVSPMGIFLIPSLLHDFAYEHDFLWVANNKIGEHEPAYIKYTGDGKITDRQKVWDRLFREVSIDVHGMKWFSSALYSVLRVGGRFAWKKSREADAVPIDPNLTN